MEQDTKDKFNYLSAYFLASENLSRALGLVNLVDGLEYRLASHLATRLLIGLLSSLILNHTIIHVSPSPIQLHSL